MKKLTVWALLATFLVAGAAFATPAKVAPNASYPYFTGGAPATTNNDDSCDIGVYPAATLLLPYFEVAEDPTGETTLFTITNTSAGDTIAHVVLWTDWSFPVIDFNIYLTGYDVQAINLNDIIWRGVIAPASGEKDFDGTSNTASGSPQGENSFRDSSLNDDAACAGLAGSLPDVYVEKMQLAFTQGIDEFPTGDCGSTRIGGVHENAVGYATIDVMDTCNTQLPTSGSAYFALLRYDNILIGDFQQVNSDNNFAQGNPMVHIRAIPEELDGDGGDAVGLAGLADSSDATNFDRTFYSRYQAFEADGLRGTADRRQPLPSQFAARWISGGDTGFDTNFKIWREGVTGAGASCASYASNRDLLVTESVIFDEDENGEGVVGSDIIISPPIEADSIVLPETSLTNITDDGVFPQGVASTGGWVYLNLDSGAEEFDDDDYLGEDVFASQNWVVVSMRSEGRYSVDFDAAALGNGCTPPAEVSEWSEGDAVIGPAADFTPCVNCLE